MASKPEYVDLIRDATRQNRRRVEARVVKRVIEQPEEPPQPERRLSNWPPGRFAQWRLENLTPWKMKLKGWKFKDWV
ncbi:hypothetical protein [Bradyrhizobium sp. STM 3562]|uniref:hypothetical protein n=1 Tax=Bradyrhizobium sp. STM 3562 TaxID=578924 RepID=UPI00388D79EB